MTEAYDFNEDEWHELRQLPIIVATLISAVDYSSLSENKEFEAFANFIQNVASKHNETSLIATVLGDVQNVDSATFQAECTSVASALSGEKPVEQALKRIKHAGELLDERLDKRNAKAFKNFIVDVAVVVARAHKESMLPFASTISKVEDYHIRRIETALGI